MTPKQISVIVILIGSVIFPIIIIFFFIQALLVDGGWDNSLLKKLLKELE